MFLFHVLIPVQSSSRLCCADISGDESRLCTGFEDSSIRVWSLGTEPLQIGTAAPVNIAMVHLAGDFLPDVVSKNRYVMDKYLCHIKLQYTSLVPIEGKSSVCDLYET